MQPTKILKIPSTSAYLPLTLTHKLNRSISSSPPSPTGMILPLSLITSLCGTVLALFGALQWVSNDGFFVGSMVEASPKGAQNPVNIE